MTLSLDVLRMTRSPDTAAPYFIDHDIKSTQVLILDDEEYGPYFSLWSLFAGKPIIRLSDLALPVNFVGNLIVPLSGRGKSPLAGRLGSPHVRRLIATSHVLPPCPQILSS
ncbi:hypothetical protein BDW74DRAFT_130233 [Aspergillus multicolor]|uniref:DUF563 domain protein n=1 Tax=Aspergillus multicolor TaxID=41759 RepID=UPI003CCCA28B